MGEARLDCVSKCAGARQVPVRCVADMANETQTAYSNCHNETITTKFKNTEILKLANSILRFLYIVNSPNKYLNLGIVI